MSKLLAKIRTLFKQDDQFIKDESLKAVHTWLLEDQQKQDSQKKELLPPQSKTKAMQGYKKYQEVSDQKKRDELDKVKGILAGAKTNFTQDEFDDRKKEVLDFLTDLKKQKSKK